MPTIKLTIEYDGSAYAGWQRQPNQPTIQAAVETALAQISQSSITTVAAGRTDAGVHALGQVVSFQSGKTLSLHEWSRGLNGLLPADITVQKVESATENFHARYSAQSKVYEYRILNAPFPPALNRLRVWHMPHSLNISDMEQAARDFLGPHDFSSFQGSPTDNTNPMCCIERCTITKEGPLLLVHIQADRFLKQMVRAMVGTLVEIGQNKRPPDAISSILEATDRCAAGKTAPPHGLYLVEVLYSLSGPR